MQTEQVNSEVMTLVMPWLRDIVHLNPKSIAISVLLGKLRSFNNSKTFFFNNSIHVCIGIHVNCVKFERHAWPYPP